MEHRIIINIGRQYGSGGKCIANILGEKLGIPVYDTNLLEEAARQIGFSPELFRDRDEKRRLWKIGSIFNSNRFENLSGGLNDTQLFAYQSETIRNIAQNGSAIFVGRAADYVLRDFNCLNVFIWAPMETRKERICERTGVSMEEVESLIYKTDHGRAQYYNFFTLGHWGKAATYHLCIDSSKLGMEGTAEFIIDFGKKCGIIL